MIPYVRSTGYRTRVSAAVLAFVLISGTVTMLSTPQQAEAVTFGTPTNLSNSANVGTSGVFGNTIKIATSGNSVYVVWTTVTSSSQDVGKHLIFRKSSDNGVTFGAPIVISGNIGAPYQHQMVIEGNNVYVAFQDSSDNTSNQPSVYFVASNDGGTTFGNPILLGTRSSNLASIEASGTNVYVTWNKIGGAPNYGEVFFARSTDYGNTFSAPVNLSNNSGDSKNSRIAVSGTHVYVGWTDSIVPPTLATGSDILVRTSTDGGATFGGPVNVSNSPGLVGFNLGQNRKPTMLAAGNSLYVTWMDNSVGNDEIFFAKSTDAGASYSSPLNVSSDPLRQVRPAIALSAGNIVLSWDGPEPGHTRSHVWAATSGDSGNSFGAPVKITTNAGNSFDASITSFGANVYLTWQDTVLNAGAVKATDSSDSGISFGAPAVVGDKGLIGAGGCSGQCEPQIAASNAGVFVAWVFNWSGGGGEVYLNSAVTSSAPPIAAINGPYETDEGSPVTLDGSSSLDPDGTIVLYEWDLDNDGEYDDATGATPSVVFADNGLFTIGLRVTDDSGLTASDTTEVTVNNLPPQVGPISAPLEPVLINTEISAGASFTDAGILDTHTAVWDWGDGSTSVGTVAESNGSGSVAGTHAYTSPGVHTLRLVVTDDDGGVGTQTFQYVVVYDPNGGFVTGGGWIFSPEGAYAADASLTGKANFGFVSKYLKGSTTPTGNTEFQFKAGDLHFKSGDYQYLVIQVSNAKAQFMGSGTINGQGNYGFKLTAIDADVNTNDAHMADKFRIKIWDKNNGDAIVYDNQMGAEDDADPTTVIGGGSIKIHKS